MVQVTPAISKLSDMAELGDSWSLVRQGSNSVAGSDVGESHGLENMQITLGSGSPMQYKDPQTGQVISKDQISASLRQLDTVLANLGEGRKVYKRVKHETGDRELAKQAGNEAAGGSLTQLMDGLCRDHVLVNMVVVCPSCADERIMRLNEQRLKLVIRQINEFLHGQIADIFTSRKEIGQVSQSFVYVRFPYYLTNDVMTLATALSQVNVGPHFFKASVTYDGRAKLTKHFAVVEQWDIEIAGRKIPAISSEELADISAEQYASYERQYFMRSETEKNHTFSMDEIDEDEAHAELSKFLYDHEIAHIYDMQTYRLAQLLHSNRVKDNMEAYFQIAGLVIDAAANIGITDPAGMSVRCFQAKEEITFTESTLWLSTKVGNQYLTLDGPFDTNIGVGETDFLKKDGPAGCIVAFCLQYHLGGPSGMYIDKAGLAFVQHLSSKKSTTNLQCLANVMKTHLADFSAKWACIQARSDHASATSSSSSLLQ